MMDTTLVIFWKVEDVDKADRDTANIEGNETARRRLLLRFLNKVA